MAMTRVTLVIVALALGLGASLARSGEAQSDRDPLKRLNELLPELDSDDSSARDRARASLAELVSNYGARLESELIALRKDASAEVALSLDPEIKRTGRMRFDERFFSWLRKKGFPALKDRPFGRVLTYHNEVSEDDQNQYWVGFLLAQEEKDIKLTLGLRSYSAAGADGYLKGLHFEKLDFHAFLENEYGETKRERTSRRLDTSIDT